MDKCFGGKNRHFLFLHTVRSTPCTLTGNLQIEICSTREGEKKVNREDLVLPVLRTNGITLSEIFVVVFIFLFFSMEN